MKPTVRNFSRQLALTTFASLLFTCQSHALDVINPNGTAYANISDNSHYDGSYTAANLFEQDLTTVPVGSTLTDGNEYARSGTGDCFVAFQLDQNYTNVGSVFYAQRGGSDPTADKIGEIDVWASATTPFTAADPGTPAAATALVTNTTGALWLEYALSNTVSGQYFLLRLHQIGTPSGNPGGRELRLGANLGQPPGAFAPAPQNNILYAGGTAVFTGISPSGTAPLIYTWTFGTNVITNGGSISGATNSSLVISNVTFTQAGTYTLTVSNAYNVISASATLTVLSAPTAAAETSIISNSPVAFYQLDETSGSIAYDKIGSLNGAYGSSTGLGLPGPQPPAFPGFASTNDAIEMTQFTIASAVTLPPFNLTNAANTNSLTLLAWIYPDDSVGNQQPYTGIVFGRGAGTVAGLICSADGTKLGYQWGGNRYDFNSGLSLPTNQWTMVALVYNPSFVTLYLGSTNGLLLSAVDNFPLPAQSFAGPTFIGLDPDIGESSRTFNGEIDDVAVFNHALTTQQLTAIYAAATGVNPGVAILSQTTNGAAVLGDTVKLSVTVSGLNPKFQWYKNNIAIPGATNSTYTVTTNATASDAAPYYVIVSNQVNSATSSVVNVTVTTYSVLPVSPTGAAYTGLIESTEFPDGNFSYTSTNLFDVNLTGVPVGTPLSGKEWAIPGSGPAYLAFQVDQTYPVSAVFYAQRNGSDATADKITQISLWASTTSAFTNAADPGTPPDAVIPVTDPSGGILDRYMLPSPVSGKYFLIALQQIPVATAGANNIGGSEFRLGVSVTFSVLGFTRPTANTLTLHWTSGTLQQATSLLGPWTNATGITSDVPFSTGTGTEFYRLKN